MTLSVSSDSLSLPLTRSQDWGESRGNRVGGCCRYSSPFPPPGGGRVRGPVREVAPDLKINYYIFNNIFRYENYMRRRIRLHHTLTDREVTKK